MTMSIRERQGIKEHEVEYGKEVAAKEAARLAPINRAARRTAELEQQVIATERQIVRDEIFKKPSDVFKTLCADYKTRDHLTVEQVHAAVGVALTALKKYLLDEFGIEMQQGSLTKLARIYELNKFNFDVTSLENWKAVTKYLDENEIFTDDDFKVVRTIAAPVVETPAPTLADISNAIEAQDTTTREGAKAARKLAVEGIVTAAQPTYREFAAYLVETFDRYITKAEGDQCVDYMRRSNWRLDDIRNWHRCRKIVLQLLTPEEEYQQQMDIDADTLTGPEFANKYRLQVNRGTLA